MPYWRLYYHVTWSTARRVPWLTGDRAEVVEACLRKKVREMGGILHAIAVQPEHVHLAVSLPPAKALGKTIGELKGVSSFLVRDRHPSLVEEGFAWQEEYGIVSMNEGTLPIVVGYIEHQDERHAGDDLWGVFESDDSGPNDKPSLG